jgi:L-ornithine N5-oxygenase
MVDNSRLLPDYIQELESTPDNELFDLIVAGFGPAGLAIAIALQDALEEANRNGTPVVKKPKVLFLEKQTQFAWHAGMLLPGASMQISFVKDLASLRNPLSKFTFLNYLHTSKRLVQFTQLNTFLPSREEFEDYLRWCSSHFSNVARFGEAVESISPVSESGGFKTDNSSFDYLQVQSKKSSGEIITRRAKHVVISIGGYPVIPNPFSSNPHAKYMHSSQYNYTIDRVLPDNNAPYSIAVIGGGQSGAEIFQNLQSRYPNAKTHLIIRDSALRPSDDSPFVNEVFDPDRISGIFDSPEALRSSIRTVNKSTNYGVVRLDLLEELYRTVFLQRLHYGMDESNWQHRILRDSKIQNVVFQDPSKISIGLEWNSGVATKSQRQSFNFDAIVFATGYKRDGYQKLLEPLTEVFGPTNQWSKISKDYRLLVPGCTNNNTGVWLQGCNEATHGVSIDSILMRTLSDLAL